METTTRATHVDTEHPLGRPPGALPPHQPAPPTRETDRGGFVIEPIDLGDRAARKRFLGMVEPIYRGDPHFIMPLWFERMQFLDPKKNPSMPHLEYRAFVARRGERIVGRIVAHVDRAYNAYHETEDTGWFGFFECEDDRAVAHALFDTAIEWIRTKGVKEIIGPMNFSTNHQCGLLVENFDRPPVVEMTYNPRWYPALIESYGFGKAKDLLCWWIDVSAGLENPKVARVAKVARRAGERAGVVLRHANKAVFKDEVRRLFTIYNEAWQKNWGYVPVKQPEFEKIADDLKMIIREELILFVEVDGKPVGFSVTVPDVNEAMPRDGRLLPFGWLKLLTGLKRTKHARLMALGMKPEYRKRGLESLLFIETALAVRRLGMNAGEIGWTLEDNDLVNAAIGHMDGKMDRRYRLYGLSL